MASVRGTKVNYKFLIKATVLGLLLIGVSCTFSIKSRLMEIEPFGSRGSERHCGCLCIEGQDCHPLELAGRS